MIVRIEESESSAEIKNACGFRSVSLFAGLSWHSNRYQVGV